MADLNNADLETLLGYSFNEPELMDMAISLRERGKEPRPKKKKDRGLATLGEAVMGCVVVNHFYSQGMNSEKINEERSARVCRENHARIAEEIGLSRYLMPANGSAKSGRPAVNALGQSLEEIMGAIYLDDINAGGTGIGACWEVLRKINMI
ncbi:MAG: hypothetical protein ISF22_09235 [Methanomassiliicoccus sp.]|nr:hypothetical protein [Methanomassiliicoccus sp.]